MKKRDFRYTPPDVIEAIIAQVRFGERMAIKYGNDAIAERFGLHRCTISVLLRRYRHAHGLPTGMKNKRRRGRSPKKASVWSAALRA